MKKMAFLYSLALGLMSISVFAQQRNDFKGHVIDSKGDVYYEGIVVGKVTKGGDIRDVKGKKVATVNGDGTVIDASGKKIGRVGKDGKTYYDEGGNVVLTVEDTSTETCNIKDANGKVIGNVHSSYKSMICSVHCLQNKMDMKDHKKKPEEHKH